MSKGEANSRRWGLNLIKWLGLAAGAALLWLVSCLGMVAILPLTKMPPTWSASSGMPVPDECLYLMYPQGPSVRLFDKPDGADVGPLTRAVANTESELNNGAAWFEVRISNEPEVVAWVRRSDLQFDPPGGSAGDLEEAYAAAFRARSPEVKFRGASVERSVIVAGTTRVTFRRSLDDDHYEVFEYTVSGTGAGSVATPLEMSRIFGPGQALSSLPQLLCSMLVATGVLVAVRVVVRRLVRERAMRRLERGGQAGAQIGASSGADASPQALG